MANRTGIGLGFLACLLVVACLSRGSAEEGCDVFPAPICDASVKVSLFGEESYVFPGPLLMKLRVENGSSHQVGMPLGDVSMIHSWLSFDLIKEGTLEVSSLRRPGIWDYETLAEGPSGSRLYQSIPLEPGASCSYLVDLFDYLPPIALSPGEYRVRVLIYYQPGAPMRTVDGPVIRLVGGSEDDTQYVKQLGLFEKGAKPSFLLVNALVKDAQLRDTPGLSETLTRQMDFYWAWAAALAEESETPLVQRMSRAAAGGLWHDEMAVLAYEVQRQLGESARAVATRSAVIAESPGVAWRFERADKGRGFLAVPIRSRCSERSQGLGR